MKNLGYRLLKFWITSGLYLYYGKIKISGLENIPRNGPVLFLPNHQGALMDVLLIVTDCHRKPFFLTRSDVFERTSLKKFFAYLRMLPIYRIRDGRESLKKNQAVFDECVRLFQKRHALVMFPEASHNIKRRVRPLSKGFTRILFNTLDKTPELKIHIIPVGMNYRSNTGFPDKVALCYGTPILAHALYDSMVVQESSNRIRDAVSESLKKLTIHIADEENYDATLQKLDALGVDYLKPKVTNEAIKKLDALGVDCLKSEETNAAIKNMDSSYCSAMNLKNQTALNAFFKGFFNILNFPVLILWRTWIKPKVWEPEFMGTMRFGFALMAYPIYYGILFVVLAAIWNAALGCTAIVALFLFNWAYVRWN